MKSKPGSRRSNTAIKGCPRCKKLVPTATRYCRCGFDFKKPNPEGKATQSASTSRAPPPVAAAAPTEVCRKSERRRITVKPDFYSPSDYENPFKKRRSRTTSDTSLSDDNIKRKRGRPRQSLSGLARSPVKPVKEEKKGRLLVPASTPIASAEMKEKKEQKDKDKEQPEVDPYSNILPEKNLQYAIILSEINRKFGGQSFKPL